jgi:hypothetical protein
LKAIVKFWLISLSLFLPQIIVAGEIAVIAYPSVGSVVVSQVKLVNLFLIPGTTWPDGQMAVPIDLTMPAHIKADFYRLALGRSQSQLRAYWARQVFSGMGAPPLEVSSAPEVVRIVSNTLGAIGYVPLDAVEGASVRILAIFSD